ncbi:ABC transporter permease [Alphaproteobacteria bacterium]|nr:ABC transporter permease [Alphaproteobacteria bacterium]
MMLFRSGFEVLFSKSQKPVMPHTRESFCYLFINREDDPCFCQERKIRKRELKDFVCLIYVCFFFMFDGMHIFFKALKETVKIAPVWWHMAYQDLISRYRRTTLGPWWITLGTGIGIGAMGIIWSTVFNASIDDFFPHMSIGFVLWMFITSTLTEGPLIYVVSGQVLRTIRIPILTFVFTSLLKNIYTLGHNAIIAVIILILFKAKISPTTLLFIPGLIILLISSFLSSVVLGILGARFRDLSHIIVSMMTFLFMLTPVMWNINILTGKKIILAYLNPFAHYLAIVRDPLLNKVPNALHYYVALGIVLLLLGAASSLYRRYAHRLVYWI